MTSVSTSAASTSRASSPAAVISLDHAGGTAAGTPIERALARAHGILPDQGPIGVFVHHNTLHAFQHQPFHEGVQEGAALLGARPYLDIHEFREHWRQGRIEDTDVDAALTRDLGARANEIGALGLSRLALRRALLRDVIDEDDEAGVAYRHAHAATPLHGAASVVAARTRLAGRPDLQLVGDAPELRRHRDALLALGGPDTDIAVHGEMIRLSAVFLDHGQAMSVMPQRDRGFLQAVAALYADGSTEPAACPGVRNDLLAACREARTPRQVIDSTLRALGVDDSQAESYLLATALALPGWTGMFSRLERHPEEIEGPAVVSLADFLAVRLLHERRAVESATRAAGVPIEWSALHARVARTTRRSPEALAWIVAGLAETAGMAPDALRDIADDAIERLVREVAEFPRIARRRMLQEAFERRYRRQVLDALHALRPEMAAVASTRPGAQYVFCIDEREESIRRALEEIDPGIETFGVAGFFGVAIDYLGLYDESPAAHCPVVITPAHEVHESPVPDALHWHLRRSGLRDRWRAASRMVHRQSRTLSGGAGLSFLLGPLAAALALSRVVAPRTSLAMADGARERFAPRPGTQLSALRANDARTTERGKVVGFTLDEAVDRVGSVLRAIGLVERFAPVVIILGHGSTSLNNPHESAHDCGACGGRRGGGNARLFAAMANTPAVRDALRTQGLTIPDDTWFIGGLHDTADDAVTLYDLEAMPVSFAEAFQRAHDALDAARRESAAERCRRFFNAPLGISPDDALRHVQGRASHLAQPRPEYGHCTNAICIVGRRRISRGLHFDRRAFLVSYDPTTDADAAILTRILAAVGPVGAGISLEYYFSSVDNERFGCGTKLPHNVTGLVGVMAGHQSDLRTGLPLQMVEIHEPMRLLLIVDATPAAILTVAQRNGEVAELAVNEWVQLVSCDPETGAMEIFEDGRFVPYTPGSAPLPRVARSRDWHMQGRQHLPPALITDALTARSPSRG